MNKKHELCREWNKTVNRKLPHGNPQLYEKFSNYRRNLKKIIKWAKSNYYGRQFEKSSGDMKKTWQLINGIRGKNKRSIKPLFIIDNERVIDRRIIANKFNQYFTSIASNMLSIVIKKIMIIIIIMMIIMMMELLKLYNQNLHKFTRLMSHKSTRFCSNQKSCSKVILLH